ncbi:MAG: galactose mutarotase [Oscillospiraceae bacterium]|nr:galactose mutarotase [Oscillospiraceae bacterium]
MSIDWKEFGYHLGYCCYLVTLKNKSGYSVSLTNYGAAMQSLCVPDKNGSFGDIVLGYDTLEEYVKGDSCFGASIGRFANRIGGAKFSLNGKEYNLFDNNNGNTLHGGEYGYHKRVWTVEKLRDGDEPFVVFKYVSPNGEEHFPGTLTLTVKYTLLQNGVKIDYNAVCAEDTIVNFTNHSYFNLKGEGSGDIKDHVVQINAKQYTPVDEKLIPTGVLAYTTGTPFDFTNPKRVGEDMDNGRLSNGYDHNFVLGGDMRRRVAAVVSEPESGRVMTVTTDMPAMQMYVAIGLNNENGKGGKIYPKYGGLCLETQFSPDTPNKPQFPSCVLKAGEEFNSTTEYTFAVDI